jgi:hypothetical protein
MTDFLHDVPPFFLDGANSTLQFAQGNGMK